MAGSRPGPGCRCDPSPIGLRRVCRPSTANPTTRPGAAIDPAVAHDTRFVPRHRLIGTGRQRRAGPEACARSIDVRPAGPHWCTRGIAVMMLGVRCGMERWCPPGSERVREQRLSRSKALSTLTLQSRLPIGRRMRSRWRRTTRRTSCTSCSTTPAFSAMEPFGGLIETPNINRIANSGLVSNNFHTTALCSPTRSCLLTGRNHTTNSMASITEAAARVPQFERPYPVRVRQRRRGSR